MRLPNPKLNLISTITALCALIIVLMPFHAFLTVWASSIFGHYTLLRLWKEAILLIIFAVVAYLMIRKRQFSAKTLNQKLVWLIVCYALVNILSGLWAFRNDNVSLKSLGYGLIINLRFLAFFLVAWYISLYSTWLKQNWLRLVLWPAVIVASFAVIQELFLPSRFLEYFGYSKYTIIPFQYVDNNPLFMRVQSTLRGANPLGTYLLVIISIAIATLPIGRDIRQVFKNKLNLAVIALSLPALYFTYSRSATLGVVVSVVIILFISLKSAVAKRNALIVASGLMLTIGVIGFSLRNNTQLQNIVFHTQSQSPNETNSNEQRASSLIAGINDLVESPLGTGVGTAGPASVYNTDGRISENYYIQIGQETGWVGLGIFLGINGIVGLILFKNRRDTLSLALFASFMGLIVVNSLSHAWADDTLAYLWWGLAGIAIAQRVVRKD